MAVYPTLGVDLGLHTSSFRDTLIDEEWIEACLPLAETRNTKAHDISGKHHHGTFVGTGFARGVSLGLPEGGLGCGFDGNGYVLVPYTDNVGLAAGDIDAYFLIKTTTNTATKRAIGQAQTTNASGNGWHVAFQSGAVRFFLRVAGVTIFDFSRGSIADGAWHLVHCCYQTGPGEARIFIDAVQSGATQTGVTTEPELTSAPMRIGMFTDGVAGDGSGFIGTLAYFTIGREGNTALSVALQATRSWTSVATDTRAQMPITIRYGIPGSGPLDNTATTGTATLALNNAATNSVGLLGAYSTAHTNCRSGFRKGSPLRVSFTYLGTTYYKHVGRIASITPSPGIYRDRLSRVTSTDWIDIAAGSRLDGLRAQIALDSDDVAGRVIDEALRPPHAVELSIGVETFPYSVDVGTRETVLSELSRIATSERGYVYVKGDTVTGGVLVFEGRGDRQVDTTLAATFTNSMHGMTAGDSMAPNIVRVTIHPREVDPASTTVLFAMTARQSIPPGQTRLIEVAYRDPLQPSVPIGGTDVLPPVAYSDYTMAAGADGTGADLTAYVVIAEATEDLGGTSATLSVTNTHPVLVGHFMTQLRGKGIYHEAPVTIQVPDKASVRKNGPTPQDIDLRYVASSDFAFDVGSHVLSLFQASQVRTLSFLANVSSALMVQALVREPGDRIGIVETVTGTTTTTDTVAQRGWTINHVELTVQPGPMLFVTWTLSPSLETGTVWAIGIVGSSELGETTVLGL